MAARTGDFSQGKVSRNILRLGLPMMLAELVHVLYNIVDRMYIGHMPEGGTIALTGLGISFPLITLIGAFANLCSTGGATLATIARGGNDDVKAERIMGTAFTMLMMVVLWNKIANPADMIKGRIQFTLVTLAIWGVYRLWPCRLTIFLRVLVQMAFLGWWYPDTYEINRALPNLDHVEHHVEKLEFFDENTEITD